MRTNTKKVLGAVAIAGLVVAGGSAFTNSNTVATSKAGAGEGVITGYDVSNVVYTFTEDAAVGLKYDTVTYTLSDTATLSRSRVNSAGEVDGTFVDCGLTTDATDDANRWTCTLIGGVSAEAAIALEVVATNENGTDVVAV